MPGFKRHGLLEGCADEEQVIWLPVPGRLNRFLVGLRRSLVLFGGFVTAVVGLANFLGLSRLSDSPGGWGLVVGLWVCAGVVALLEFGARTRFRVDLEREQISFGFALGGDAAQRPLLGFAEVQALAVDGRQANEEEKRWSHWVVLVTQEGEARVFSPQAREQLEQVNACGAILAERMGLPFHPAPPGSELEIVRDARGGVHVAYRPHQFLRQWARLLGPPLALVLIAIVLTLIHLS